MGGRTDVPFNDGSKNISCEDISIKTQLSSPDPEVIKHLKDGDILEIVLSRPTGPCNAFHNKKLAGTIINRHLRKIIECIVGGHTFIAVVRSVDGARCAVTVINILKS